MNAAAALRRFTVFLTATAGVMLVALILVIASRVLERLAAATGVVV